jgi:hypothetical protein
LRIAAVYSTRRSQKGPEASIAGKFWRPVGELNAVDPVIGNKMRAALRDPSVRAKVREATLAQWADPELRTKMISGMKAARERRKKTT